MCARRAGFCLRGGLHIVSLALLIGRAPARQRRQQSVYEKLVETWRYALFLGSLAGTYTFVDEGLAWLLGKDRHACGGAPLPAARSAARAHKFCHAGQRGGARAQPALPAGPRFC